MLRTDVPVEAPWEPVVPRITPQYLCLPTAPFTPPERPRVGRGRAFTHLHTPIRNQGLEPRTR